MLSVTIFVHSLSKISDVLRRGGSGWGLTLPLKRSSWTLLLPIGMFDTAEHRTFRRWSHKISNAEPNRPCISWRTEVKMVHSTCVISLTRSASTMHAVSMVRTEAHVTWWRTEGFILQDTDRLKGSWVLFLERT